MENPVCATCGEGISMRWPCLIFKLSHMLSLLLLSNSDVCGWVGSWVGGWVGGWVCLLGCVLAVFCSHLEIPITLL